MSKQMKTILIIVGVVVLVGFMTFGKIIAGYNRVIAMDENVKGKWAQVENQLKRRYDLIPNLVETVKGYAKHEKELFENIAQARTKPQTSSKVCSQGFFCFRKGIQSSRLMNRS
jgi:LemA protein